MNNKHNPKVNDEFIYEDLQRKNRILQSLNKLKGHILNLYL